jgi:hypothetical protein
MQEGKEGAFLKKGAPKTFETFYIGCFNVPRSKSFLRSWRADDGARRSLNRAAGNASKKRLLAS